MADQQVVWIGRLLAVALGLGLASFTGVLMIGTSVGHLKKDNRALKHKWVQTNSDLSALEACIQNTAYTRDMMTQCVSDYYSAGRP
jgi:hypothetical protein